MIWLKKSKIKGVGDLRGKTIATAGIPYQDAFLKTILARANLSPSAVKAVNVGYGLLPALVSGSAEAMLGGFSNVEGVDLRERGKEPTVTPVDRLGVPTYDELVLVGQRKRIEEDPEAFRLFIAALARGTTAAAANPKAATEALLEANSSLDPKLTRAEVKATLPLLDPKHRRASLWLHGPRSLEHLHRLDARQRPDLLAPGHRRSAQQLLPAGQRPRIARQALDQHARNLLGWQRAREEVALSVVAAQSAQLRELDLALHALGDHIEREGARHPDDRLDDRGALLLDPQRFDEGAIDLQSVKGKAVEIGERGVPGAEVIEHETNADVTECLQGGGRGGRLLDQDALGDLEAQVPGVQAGAGEDLGDRSRADRDGPPGGLRG